MTSKEVVIKVVRFVSFWFVCLVLVLHDKFGSFCLILVCKLYFGLHNKFNLFWFKPPRVGFS